MTTRTQDPSVQRPPRITSRGLLAVGGALAAASTAALVAAPAHAEYANLTSQAVRAHADWLAWAPEPDNGPVAVCLVDTGVDTNPDTSSSVIAASPLDADSAPGDGGTTKHGTLMAEIMAAPLNDYGMVGAWPQLEIVDIRAVTPGANTFTYMNYQRAVQRCAFATPVGTSLKVVNLSLGGGPALVTQEERNALSAVVDSRRAGGVNIVAAAGNAGGGVLTPGDMASIFTVAAGDNGALCDFASRGPQVDIAAPGCGLDQAFADGSPAIDGWGSSQASAFTSAVIAALRAYKSSLTVAQAEAALTTTATPTSDGYLQLDVEAAFDSVGLSDLVAEAKVAELAGLAAAQPSSGGGNNTGGGNGGGAVEKPADPAPVGTPAPSDPVAAPQAQTAPTFSPVVEDAPLRTPRIGPLRSTSKGTTLTLANRPKDALAIVTVYATTGAKTASGKGRVIKRLRGMKSRFVIPAGKWSRVEVVYRDGLSPDSTPLVINAPKKPSAAASKGAKSPEKRASR